MHAYPQFLMSSVHFGRQDRSVRRGSDQPTAVSDHGNDRVRKAVGGGVIDHEFSDRELAGDALPEAIDF